MTTCTLCNCEWPAQPTRCVCGYDFETGNTRDAIRALTIQQRSANRRWLAGVGTFLSSAVTLVLASMYPTFMIVMPIIVSAQVLFGLGLVASGLRSGVRIGRQITRAKTLHQLPEARLLK